MAIYDRTVIRTSVSGDLADNSAGNISAEDIRENLIHILDSTLNAAATGDNNIASSGDAAGGTGVTTFLWSPSIIKHAIDSLVPGGIGGPITGINDDKTPILGGHLTLGGYAIQSSGDKDLYIMPGNSGGLGSSGTVGLGNWSTNFQRRWFSTSQTSQGDYSVIFGGTHNQTTSDSPFSIIGGGSGNSTTKQSCVIGGGYNNTASNLFGFIGNGTGNETKSAHNIIVGGIDNYAGTISQTYARLSSTVINGSGNSSTDKGSFIGNGLSNTSAGQFSFIGNGTEQLAKADYSIVLGGTSNKIYANQNHSSIINGSGNIITGVGTDWYNTILGGRSNSIGGAWSTIVNGDSINVSGDYNTVIGGRNHTIHSNDTVHSIILGGDSGIVNSGTNFAFIGPGSGNTVLGGIGNYNSILSGKNNSIGGHVNVITMGSGNVASGTGNFIGGGLNNDLRANYSAILGGHDNTIGESGGVVTNSFIIGSEAEVLVASGIQIGSGVLDRARTIGLGSSINIPIDSGAPSSSKNGDIWQQDNAIYLNSRSNQWSPRGEVRFVKSMPPSASGAGLSHVSGVVDAGDIASIVPVLTFDDTSSEFMDYLVYMDRNYASGDVKFNIHWTCLEDNPTKAVVWSVGLRSLSSGTDLDTSHTYSFESASGIGHDEHIMRTTSIVFSSGEINAWKADDYAILRLGRIATASGEDTVSGDASVIMINGYENL